MLACEEKNSKLLHPIEAALGKLQQKPQPALRPVVAVASEAKLLLFSFKAQTLEPQSGEFKLP